MTVFLRWDQCCETPGCMKPARHGVLCVPCFLIATPARRAVELRGSRPAARPDAADAGARRVDPDGAAWLRDLWAT